MLEEANLRNAQLNNVNERNVTLYNRLSERHEGLLNTVAREQSERKDESRALRALLTTAEMTIQYECELHKGTKESLKHEREVTLRLTDYVNHLPVLRSTETESTISENVSIEYVPKLRYLEQVIEQMEKDLQAKDALIKDRQTTCDLLEEERDSIIAARACSV